MLFVRYDALLLDPPPPPPCGLVAALRGAAFLNRPRDERGFALGRRSLINFALCGFFIVFGVEGFTFLTILALFSPMVRGMSSGKLLESIHVYARRSIRRP